MHVIARKLIILLATAGLGGVGVSSPVQAAKPGVSLVQFSGMAWYVSAFELGPWAEYLAHELTPDLPLIQRVPKPRISWIPVDEIAILPEFAEALVTLREARPRLSLEAFRARRIDLSASGTDGMPVRFERSLLASGIAHHLGDRNRVTVSAVLASQQFSHSAMDLQYQDNLGAPEWSGTYNPYNEVSHGTGVRLAISSDLGSRFAFNAAYQSRINMDELANVRGVHGYSADLDIPARVQVGLDLQTTIRASISVAVSQVFYSEVGAFPSRSLPARFNALLGDSTSPQFNWNDLTVYTIGYRWRHENDFEFNLDFHTRSQPTPASPSLANALNGELAQHSFLVGVGKGVGKRSRVNLNASYAPAEFAFGGNVMGVVSDRLDQAVEVFASLNMDF